MELIVKIGNTDSISTGYQDGDVVQTFSLNRILMANAENICNVNNFSINSVTGLRENNSLLMKFLELKSKYKFERINSNDVRKTSLITGEESIVNKTPNEYGEYMDVYKFLSRRLKSHRHRVFGSSGNEIWYGKSRLDVDLDALWNSIESHSDNLKSENSSWKFSEIEKRMFLVLNCCTHTCLDHDEHEGEDHESGCCIACTCDCSLGEVSQDIVDEKTQSIYRDGEPILDEATGIESSDNPVEKIMIARRKFVVPYWDYSSSLSLNVDDIRNISKEVDGRKSLESRPSSETLTVDKVVAGIVTP
jgi:hypothetical protein